MENTPIDTQLNRTNQWEVNYWSNIDRVDMELSGLSVKYNNTQELADSLGLDEDSIHKILSRIRKRLVRSYDNIEQHGQL